MSGQNTQKKQKLHKKKAIKLYGILYIFLSVISVKDHIFGEKQYGHTADNQVSHVSYKTKSQYGEKTLNQESFLYDKSQNISQAQQRIKDWQDNIKNVHGISRHQKHSYNKGGLVKDIIVGSGRHVQYHYDEHSLWGKWKMLKLDAFIISDKP